MRKEKRQIITALNVLLPLLLMGSMMLCSAQSLSDGERSSSKNLNRQKGQTEINGGTEQSKKMLSDQWIIGLVEGAFLFNKYLKDYPIDAEADGSTVVLNGSVGTEIEKSLAEQIALSIEGVEDIDNQLTLANVKPAQDLKNTQGIKAVLSNAAISTKVKSRLLANGQTSGLAIKVSTDNGEVALEGTVESELERELAFYITQNTDGVIAVDNQLVVRVNNRAASISQ